MGKLLDLTGRRFGLLYVVRRVEDRKPGRPMWLCECDCGNNVVVSSTNLTKADGTQSCGCLKHRPSPALIDLSGKRFERLKVIYRDFNKPAGKVYWICKCDCGKIISTSSDSLKNGKTKSCGCLRKELKHDLTGQEFGYLKVLHPINNERIKGNETRWKCLCSNCGKTIEVSSYWLRHSDPYGHCNCTRFDKPTL